VDIILLQDVPKVGTKHELVKVKNGYGRNYLIPKGLALLADMSKKKMAEALIKQQALKAEQQTKDAKSFAEKLNKAKILIEAKTGQKDKLFGSVTTTQIAKAIEEQAKIKIDKKIISLKEDIKKVGAYKINIKLDKEVETIINLEVSAEKNPKKESAKGKDKAEK